MMTPDGFMGTATEALAYARENGIRGTLIRRLRGGRELRSYRIDRAPLPLHMIYATAEEHVS